MTKDENQQYVGSENLKVTSNSNKLVIVHYGTDGMKWGRRKYQYEDGSLTPLGRIHYGVGEAKEKSKIKIREAQAKAKAAAKVEKAKAKAELEKIKAQAKAYRAKKDADEETERQRIKAEKEAEEARTKAELKAEKAHEREETRRVEAEVNADERMQKAGIEAAANQTKSENSKLTALKVVAGIAAAAGIGYLLYKKLGKSGDANSASKVIEKSEETGKKFVDNVKNKPAAEIIEKGNKAAKETAKKSTDMTDAINKLRDATKKEASSERVRAAKEKVARDELNKIKEKYFAANERHKNTYTRILKSKAKTAFNTARKQGWNQQWFFGHSDKGAVLIHSDSNELYHWGILGMKWGVRRYQNPDGTLTELGKKHYSKKAERLSNQASGYRGLRNQVEMERPFAPFVGMFGGSVAGATASGLGAVVGGSLGLVAGAGIAVLASNGAIKVADFIARKKQAKADEIVKKLGDKKAKELENEETQQYESFTKSKEYKKAEKEALKATIEVFKKEDPDQLSRMLKEVDGKESELWRFPTFDTLLDGYRDDYLDSAYKKYKTENASKNIVNKQQSSYTQLRNKHDELERQIKSEKDPLQKRFLQQELTSVTVELNDELEKINKQKHD